jgi:hypothetical protein
MTTEFLVQIGATVIALATAIASFIAAQAAKSAATQTRRATQAQLVSTLLDSYASPEMLDAMISLRTWVGKNGTLHADEFRRLRRDDYDLVRGVDLARRRVSHFFQKIDALHTLGFLDEPTVRAVATRGQVAFFREVVEPLEAAITVSYDRTSFDRLGALYGIGPTLPPMASP